MNPLVRLATALALSLLFGAPAFAVDSGDIVVAAVKGEVRVTMNGAVREVRAGSLLELPASVRTGRDGSIDLRQGATSVSVGPDTELEFPALEKRGAPVDRIVQPRGNAFYDIGKREGRKLRVETPYLVGVIKGTQFNVAAQQDATTISLFEGRLEVRATDDSAVVDLQAGEIASRRRGDKSISVIKMNEKPPTTAPRSQNQSDGNGGNDGGKPIALAPRNETPDDTRDDPTQNTPAERPIVSVNVDGAAVEVTSRDASVGATVNTPSVAVDAGVDVGNGVRVDAATNVAVDAGAAAVGTDVRATVDVGGGAASVDVGVSAGIDAGPAASVDVGTNASVNVGGNGVSVDAGVSVGVDVTPAVSVDVGTNASVDVGGNGVSVDVGAATDLGAGPITNSLDAAAGVDLGSNGVGVNVDAGVAAGVGDVAAVDTGVDLGVNAGAGTIDVDTTIDVGANVAGVDAGVSAGVDASAGAIDLGVSLGNLDVDLGIDLGLDDGNQGNGNDTGLVDTSNPGNAPAPPGNIVDDVGGLLDGLLRGPKRR